MQRQEQEQLALGVAKPEWVRLESHEQVLAAEPEPPMAARVELAQTLGMVK